MIHRWITIRVHKWLTIVRLDFWCIVPELMCRGAKFDCSLLMVLLLIIPTAAGEKGYLSNPYGICTVGRADDVTHTGVAKCTDPNKEKPRR